MRYLKTLVRTFLRQLVTHTKSVTIVDDGHIKSTFDIDVLSIIDDDHRLPNI